MDSKKIKLYIDLLFCCVFLPLIIALVPVEKWMEKYTSFAVTLILFLYCIYFAIRLANIPQLVMRRKFVKVAIIVAVMLVAAFLLSQFPYPDDAMPILSNHPGLHEHLRAQTVWFMFLVVSGYGLSTSLLLELFRQILVKKDFEEKKNKAELSLYKAQINPHFMFNTLNTLYGLAISKSDRTEDAFIKFIEILKYTYTQVSLELIPIGNEIKYIHDYIALQLLRLNSHTSVVWEYDIDDDTIQIPPMILITFVENAFKYGSSSTRDCKIQIDATLKNKYLRFSVTNNIMKEKCENEISIGLANCRARLNMLYPDRHTLLIEEKDNMYCISLDIDL